MEFKHKDYAASRKDWIARPSAGHTPHMAIGAGSTRRPIWTIRRDSFRVLFWDDGSSHLGTMQSWPGARRIQLRQYEISNSRNSNQLITEDRFTGFIPGILRMAILLYDVDIRTDKCPIRTCGPGTLLDDQGGGKTW